MEDHLLLKRLDELIDVLREKQTIVPLFFFVPTSITAEQMHETATMVRHELRKAGFKLPPQPGKPTDG